jgi:hypothetical protein
MILGLLTVAIMLAIAYAFWREGPLTAFAMFCNTLIAGIIAFNFWEPIADLLDPVFQETVLEGTEDALALMIPFLLILMGLRLATNSLASTHMEYPALMYRGGAVFFGLVTGYFLAGILVCAMQTLPIQRNFLSFEQYKPGETAAGRKLIPPDFVWLSMMSHLSGKSLNAGDKPFDARGNFEMRYARNRRVDESGKSTPHSGEFNTEEEK